MNLGLPIFAFKSGFNEYSTYNQAEYFNSSHELISIIENIDNNKLVSLGNNMKKIAEQHYSWKVIAEKYFNIINS